MKNVNFERLFYPRNNLKYRFSFDYKDNKIEYYVDNDKEAYELYNNYLKNKKEFELNILKFKKDLRNKYGIEIYF